MKNEKRGAGIAASSSLWCPEQESNLHASRHAHLKRARLPFRHLGEKKGAENETRCLRAPWARFAQERKTRLELATPTLARLCSTNWAISAWHCVKRRRLELPRLAALPPQSSASTNSATSPNKCFFSVNSVPLQGLRKCHSSELRVQMYSFFWNQQNFHALFSFFAAIFCF